MKYSTKCNDSACLISIVKLRAFIAGIQAVFTWVKRDIRKNQLLFLQL